LNFMNECGLNQYLKNVEPKVDLDESHTLYKKSIIITGFRDESLADALKSVGAKLGSSVSKNTFAVLVKDKDEDTGKANDARKLGVPLYTPEEFKNIYFTQAS